MGIFRRSDEHFSKVEWAIFIGWMAIFRRSDGQILSPNGGGGMDPSNNNEKLFLSLN